MAAPLVLLLGNPVSAQPGGAAASRRVEVAQCATGTGSIWRRQAEGKPWEPVKQGEALYSGDLLLGLPGAVVESRDRAVRLTFPSNLSGTAPLPVLETAVVLQESKDADLAFTLDRGRVDAINQKAQGAARVQIKCGDLERVGEAVLTKPGTEIALIAFGRWAAGVPFRKTPKPEEKPILQLIFLVLKGEVDLKVQKQQFALTGPPGPAQIQWDSVTGGDPTPQRLEQIPAWATDSSRAELVPEKKAALEELRQLALKSGLTAALDQFVQSPDPVKRRLAVFVMGATDDLPHFGQAASTTKYRDVWENAILAMRHWIGRAPGQDQKLYNALIKDRNYTPVDAETVLQLLHDFGEEQVARPELYETLLDFLEHKKVAVRGLAYWHLRRLVPAGRSIDYDPLASEEGRQKVVAQWRQLVPRGQVPARP